MSTFKRYLVAFLSVLALFVGTVAVVDTPVAEAHDADDDCLIEEGEPHIWGYFTNLFDCQSEDYGPAPTDAEICKSTKNKAYRYEDGDSNFAHDNDLWVQRQKTNPGTWVIHIYASKANWDFHDKIKVAQFFWFDGPC